MSVNINCVVLIGRLTKDPEVHGRRCTMRLAVSERRRDAASAEWYDRPNYFDIVTFGALAQRCADHLVRGRLIAINGALSWHEWQPDVEGAPRRQRVEVIADTVRFLDAPPASRPVTRSEPEPVAASGTVATAENGDEQPSPDGPDPSDDDGTLAEQDSSTTAGVPA